MFFGKIHGNYWYKIVHRHLFNADLFLYPNYACVSTASFLQAFDLHKPNFRLLKYSSPYLNTTNVVAKNSAEFLCFNMRIGSFQVKSITWMKHQIKLQNQAFPNPEYVMFTFIFLICFAFTFKTWCKPFFLTFLFIMSFLFSSPDTTTTRGSSIRPKARGSPISSTSINWSWSTTPLSTWVLLVSLDSLALCVYVCMPVHVQISPNPTIG